MGDFIFIGVILVFFLISVWFVRGCERLKR